MKIATWNVNSIRTRQQQVLKWLENNLVDVLCLQETKVIDQDFPKKIFENLGYNLYISGQKAYNGVAIFSRQPMTDVKCGFTPIIGELLTGHFDEQKRVISGVIDNIRIVNLYVPNGESLESDKYTYKLNWLNLLHQYLKIMRDTPPHELCICGDFNIAPEDKDIHNPQGKENHIMSSPAERRALEKLLDINLKDAFRKFTLEGGHFTWWDYRSGSFQRNLGWRIDHHYLTPKLYERAISCIIDREPRMLQKPSDHAPVILHLDELSVKS